MHSKLTSCYLSQLCRGFLLHTIKWERHVLCIVFNMCVGVVAGPPGKVGRLELTYHSEQELRLQWSRPGDFPSDVLITYHINITNTSSGAVTQVCVFNQRLSYPLYRRLLELLVYRMHKTNMLILSAPHVDPQSCWWVVARGC